MRKGSAAGGQSAEIGRVQERDGKVQLMESTTSRVWGRDKNTHLLDADTRFLNDTPAPRGVSANPSRAFIASRALRHAARHTSNKRPSNHSPEQRPNFFESTHSAPAKEASISLAGTPTADGRG